MGKKFGGGTFEKERERQQGFQRDVAVAAAEIEGLLGQLESGEIDGGVMERVLAAIEQYGQKFEGLPETEERVKEFRERFQVSLRERAA